VVTPSANEMARRMGPGVRWDDRAPGPPEPRNTAVPTISGI